jgi:hypothetical protein
MLNFQAEIDKILESTMRTYYHPRIEELLTNQNEAQYINDIASITDINSHYEILLNVDKLLPECLSKPCEYIDNQWVCGC